TENGLHVVTFDTLQGTVTVNLPDDLAAGDTISGTVVAEPKGDSAEQKAANSDSLSGVVVAVAEQETPASDGRGKWIVPAAAAVAIPLILRDRSGREIGKANVPVAKAPRSAEGFQIPVAGQSGKAVAIAGSFDGDFSTSSVKFGGTAMNVLAESPRKLVAQAPAEVSGVGEIEVTEGDVVQKCVYRNIVVKLAAPTVNLKNGQTTTMTVTVEGLAGLEKPFPVSIVNRSPAVVRVAQGDVQTFQVEPKKVAGGSFVTTRTLTGVLPGGFNINASIPPGSIAAVRCSPMAAGRAEHPTTADAAVPDRPVSTVDIASRPPELPREVPEPPEPPDDPERLRNATVAVHTGTQWRQLSDGRRIVTFRDNPPITGVIDLTPGWVYSSTAGSFADTRSVFWRRFARYQTWSDSDHKFTGAEIRTFRDPDNAAGELGVAAVGNLPAESSALRRLRFHSNGLLLEPGSPVAIALQRRSTGPAWSMVGNAHGTIELDERTAIVPVAVAVIREAAATPPAIDLALAQLWSDSRSINRSMVATSQRSSSLLVLDRDPLPGWTVDRLMDPGTGRALVSAFAQDPDLVWSQCGQYGHGIQFRLVRFGTVDATSAGPRCGNISGPGTTAPPSTIESCITGWGEALKRQTGNTTPAITIAFTADYQIARGVAQAWRTGILFGWAAVFSQTTDQTRTIAHEIGHVLGYGSALFYDGAGGPGNLMAGGGAALTREQCQAAYPTAQSFNATR
ncbi:MAG TPA: hypothetical protein VFL80_10680, partial [Thermoanaerobaculia bacterium]|nr:hypothetical protein [Thermoanaerobaculia bacterium]